MSLLGAALIGAGANVVGGWMANRQQSKQFAANLALAKDQLYRQHQIEVADLRAAGLNPILSANGGNSTFGASAGGSYENLGSAATSGFMAAQQAKNLEAQNAAIDANIVKTKAEAQNVIADTALKQAQTAHEKGLLSLIPLQRQNIYAMTEQAKQQTASWKMQVKVAEANILKIKQDTENSKRITDATVHELETRAEANEASAGASSAVAARNYAEADRISRLTPAEIEQVCSAAARNYADANNLDAETEKILAESLKITLTNERTQAGQSWATMVAPAGEFLKELNPFLWLR